AQQRRHRPGQVAGARGRHAVPDPAAAGRGAMIGYERDALRTFESRARAEPFTPDDAPSAFTDTMAAAFALTRREELSSSAAQAWGRSVEARAKKIGELGGDRRLAAEYAMIPDNWRTALNEAPEPEAAPEWRYLPDNWRRAYQHVREYARRYPDQVLDDAALWEQFKAEAAELR